MANKYWNGGTGTWDGGTLDSGFWRTATGGGGSVTSAPTTGDTAIFDATSGGGTVTVATDFNITSIQMGNFTGTLDFSINNNAVNLTGSFVVSGSGVRHLKLGSAVLTVASFQMATVTNLTFDSGTSTIKFFNSTTSGTLQSAAAISKTHNKLIIGPATTGIGAILFSGGICDIGTLEFDNTNLGAVLQVTNAANYTLLNSFNWKGSPRRPISIYAGATPPGTLSLGSGKTGVVEWAHLYGMTFAGGGTFIAKNCFDGGGNSGITFINPQSSPIGGR